MKSRSTFTCSSCHKTYVKGWSDEEALRESKDLWKGSWEAGESMAVICDTCFNRGKESALAEEKERYES